MVRARSEKQGEGKKGERVYIVVRGGIACA